MPYPWIKLYVETKDDPKVLSLTDSEFRIWINLLLNVSEMPDRGTMPPCPRRGLAANLRVSVDELETALKTFTELGMAHFDDDGALVVDHFIDRQYEKPSDAPEATRERKARERERDKSESLADVTPMSRESHAVSRDVTPPEGEGEPDVEGDPEGERRGSLAALFAAPPQTDSSAPAEKHSSKPKTPKAEPSAEKELTEAQQMWAVLAREILPDPKAAFPKQQRAAWNAAIKDLRGEGVKPDDIPLLCQNYEVRYGKRPPTPHAILCHLAEIRGPAQSARASPNGRGKPNPEIGRWPEFKRDGPVRYWQEGDDDAKDENVSRPN